MWCRGARFNGEDYSGNNQVQQARPPLGASLAIECDSSGTIDRCSFSAPSGSKFSIRQRKKQFQNGRILVVIILQIFFLTNFVKLQPQTMNFLTLFSTAFWRKRLVLKNFDLLHKNGSNSVIFGSILFCVFFAILYCWHLEQPLSVHVHKKWGELRQKWPS